eukprot:1156379-Pelagomonas_calceolata.AAC.1
MMSSIPGPRTRGCMRWLWLSPVLSRPRSAPPRLSAPCTRLLLKLLMAAGVLRAGGALAERLRVGLG